VVRTLKLYKKIIIVVPIIILLLSLFLYTQQQPKKEPEEDKNNQQDTELENKTGSIAAFKGTFQAIEVNRTWYAVISFPILNKHPFDVTISWLYYKIFNITFHDITIDFHEEINETVNMVLPSQELRLIDIRAPKDGLDKEPKGISLNLKGYIPKTENPIDLNFTTPH